MKIPNDARIFIIEGIPGSGKNTFQDILKEKFKSHTVYDYEEGELLFSWKHPWIKDIENIRFLLMNKLLDYIQEVLDSEEDSIFILNRFHLSLDIISVTKDKTFSKNYQLLINRLKKLKVHTFVLQLDTDQIENRSSHKERGKLWQLHLKKRLKSRNFSNLKEMYMWEQDLFLKFAEKQNIPYSLLKIRRKK